MHSRTPSLTVIDGRGLPVRKVAYLRSMAGNTSSTLVICQEHDLAGRLITQRDPRLSMANTATVYSLNGNAVLIDSVDSGWRVVLPGLAGEPLRRWDQRGSHWRTCFDEQLRLVAVEENGEVDVDVFTYSDASAEAGYNRRGQLQEQKDRSGSLLTDSFSLTGQPLSETRTFHDGEPFTTHHAFSPLGALLEQTDAGGHRRRSRYGLAGHLRQVQLLISGQSQWQPVLLDAQYNAADQIIEQQAGNLVLSRWTYDPADSRLHTQSSRKDTGAVLQDLEYFYDPVGNITRIEDHAFQPVYFANQLVDGHRDFSYDSLYRLVSASGYDDGPLSDIPGLPTPTDPNNRLNYTQTYTYDTGGNLVKLVHVRAGANRTVQMRIDSVSNRGVRWKPDDPEPDFETLFDRHGNQQNLQPGQAMQWNARDELQRVTLIARDGTDDDAEHYRYSQGVRVFKRHETYTDRTVHFHQVRYLPGLEIRNKDNCEELHIISVGSARCLHWAKKPPDEIANDQVRYNLEDHLGSCVMELDQQGDLISQEGYYPFGATAWMAARHAVEVGYKFTRYSGKEMDVSGLYYYGERYYSPWLQRWISADPNGDVDGLNLYAMVGNNPLLYVDRTGGKKAVFELLGDFLGMLDKAQTAANQIHNLATEFDGLVPENADINELRASMTFGTFLKSKHGIKSVLKGVAAGGTVVGLLGSVVPGAGNAIGLAVGAVVGAVAMPLLRYHFFKKGLKLAQTLHTQELKDGLNTLGETVSNGVETVKDLVNGGAALIDGIKTFTNNLNAYSEDIQQRFYKQLDSLDDEKQRQVMKLARTGVDPFDAIDRIKETAQTVLDARSEAEEVTERLQQLEQSIAEEPRPRPVAKPRLNLQLRRQARETAV
ncbi:RHS repeat-associated core domain-containing protein [Pseudomonas sp. ok266]|uniref:RHS repeat-associated core domain-containing protein n=1 Tax=Pseudomonas sp. ok266 TaxID=1761896 RepID=UPI0008C39A59|nr:RHS repeat-associated core domain-containing protein [Pseudomonas sp. ok266]SEN49661.1 insecticidal toxin complex protein TccC [Pseudomonas sp. ok266]